MGETSMQPLFRLAAFALALLIGGAIRPAIAQQPAPPASNGTAQPATTSDANLEAQLGREVFDDLRAKGEVVSASPLYKTLDPIAKAIIRVAQPQYELPFKFYIVHERQPNAFATPGGYVFVTDAMLRFAKNVEELAGTLCHETSHTIHHDSVNVMKNDERFRAIALGAAIVTRSPLTVALIEKLREQHYSRNVEESADLKGADTCAAAGYNPWGLVWLFTDFEQASQQPPEILSNHPSDEHRVAALENHFRQNPAVFGRFNPDPHSATALAVPRDAPEAFLAPAPTPSARATDLQGNRDR
jgi:predicted Zn-dependent protease